METVFIYLFINNIAHHSQRTLSLSTDLQWEDENSRYCVKLMKLKIAKSVPLSGVAL